MGGENEIESALTQLKNAKQTIAEAYAERCGKSLDDVLQAMAKETWFTASQALEFGLIDAVIDAVDLSNCLKKVSATELQAKAFKHTPDDLLNQLVQPPATPTPEPLINQQSDPMPKPIDNDALQNALKNENQRQSTIRALCATHKVSDTLRDEMLNDLNCSAEDSSLKILQYLGSISINGQEPNAEQPSTGLTNTHIHVGNGNATKDALQNALNARCGTGEIEKDNPYRLKTLLDMAEIAVGKDAKYCGNKNELVARAFNSGDFADIITESVRTVMRDEAQVRAPLWRELANTENLPNFKETDLILINDAPDLMAVSEDGEYKSATIKGSGEKIQLASFGREIAFTRQAIINDEIALISKIPRKFMQSAYRLSDKLMFNAILSGKMGDGKSVFQAGGANKWGNLVNDIPAADYEALVMALHKTFATATTSEGDVLDLRGEILLANPDHASFLEAVLNTASKPDTFNPAYKKFAKVVETARLAMINGAIALTGKDFDSVVMGFLDGAQDPWLETGDGWSSDGAKFRITYDVTSKVLDRRGIAQATFAAK
ncbi:ATP-dependent Clp protease proteolytic subunit [Photobacterium kishitanii]|uniref:phage major capsid protein n=1 Tax=Photobacterium kishitanii TaxID=318456 RepID=UPI000A73C0A3|nr:ATP-dependent Clp protease proteolytic subunit [Photobacterium kishitanii]